MQVINWKIKPIVIMVCVIYFLIGFVYAVLFGFNTHAIFNKTKERDFYNTVNEIKAAYFENDDIILCVIGKIKSSDLFQREYLIKVPVQHFQDSIELSRKKIFVNEFVKGKVKLSREFLLNSCVHRTSKPVPINRIRIEYSIDSALSEYVDQIKPKYTNGVAVYEVENVSSNRNNKDIVIKFDRILFDDSDFIIVVMKPIWWQGSKLWYAAVPAAIILDALLFPYQLMMWADYASSH